MSVGTSAPPTLVLNQRLHMGIERRPRLLPGGDEVEKALARADADVEIDHLGQHQEKDSGGGAAKLGAGSDLEEQDLLPKANGIAAEGWYVAALCQERKDNSGVLLVS